MFCRLLMIILFMLLCSCGSENMPDAEIRINRLSDQVTAVLEHYKSVDPVGLPGIPIPDPMPIGEVKTDLTFGYRLTFSNQLVYGLSKFKIESVYSNLGDLEMFMALRVDVIQVLGNYTLASWLSKTQGPSNTTVTDLYAEGTAQLNVAREGYLEASDISMDLSVADIDIHFENPGILGSILQGAVNTVGTLILDAIKPYILREINTNVLGEVNKNLRSFNSITFPNSLSPLDVLIATARNMVRSKGFDPFKVNDFKRSAGVLGLEVRNVWVTGLASFYRVGNITVEMENNTVYFGASAGTQQLTGKCDWEISMAGLVSTTGKMLFTIEYIEAQVKVNQSLDVRKKPNLESLRITLGNFQLKFDGAGTLAYVIEALVNVLPNLLREQIMLAVEEPLKMKVQEVFNDIDVEKTIKDQVNQLENMNMDSSTSNETISSSTMSTPLIEEGLTVDESQLDDEIL